MSRRILIKPVISEKMEKMGEKLNRYAFYVDKKANKGEIKRAVEEMFDVKVTSVNTLILPGKSKSRFTKSGFLSGKTSVRKKAMITLAKDEEIDFYSNI